MMDSNAAPWQLTLGASAHTATTIASEVRTTICSPAYAARAAYEAKRKGLRWPNTAGPATDSAATPAVVARPPMVITASRLGSETYTASMPRMVTARGSVNSAPVAKAVVAGMRKS